MTETVDLRARCAVPDPDTGAPCSRPLDDGDAICRPDAATLATTLRELALELGPRGEYLHRASGLEGRGPRSGTTTRSGHGDGFESSLVLAVRIVGQRARYWADTLGIRPIPHTPESVALDASRALLDLAGQIDQIRRHPDPPPVLALRAELLRHASQLMRQLDPPVPEDARWVQHLRANLTAGRDAWLPVSDVLKRWAALRKVDPEIGPPPSRRTIERWISGTPTRPAQLHAQRPPGHPLLVQVGAVVDLATRGRTTDHA